MELKRGFVGAIVLVGILIRLTSSLSAQVNILHEFKPTDGTIPVGNLVADGTYYYGMTKSGGNFVKGTIFRVQPDGSGHILLHSFAGGAEDGYDPYGSLIVSGGVLYGMTCYGGASDNGTIFKINPDGSGFSLLHSFAGNAFDGQMPFGSLIVSGGALYGMTSHGGARNYGTIFKINPDGSGFALLHSFVGGAGDGKSPHGSLIVSGGVLYGMAYSGGAGNLGTVFKIDPDGSGFSLLHTFAGGVGDGSNPYDSLIVSGGAFYGMTYSGGASDKGTVFTINPDGSGFALLHSFVGGADDGSGPLHGSLIISGGVLYGMTSSGGASGASDKGTVFKINADGSGFVLLHSFVSGAGNGEGPAGSLIASGGVLYGMTGYGGAMGRGTVFKINADGSGFTLLHSFIEGVGEGINPYDSLIVSGGVLYGMTCYGGASGSGTVFKINPDGSGFALLHTFIGGVGDGRNPYGSLIVSGGALYGMTYSGGASDKGTVFKINPDGSGYSLLHSFAFAEGVWAGGSNPYGSLIVSGGVLYGMTLSGGYDHDAGTIFKINSDGSGFAQLHSFSMSVWSGSIPYGSLILSGGALCGMTSYGGASNKGTVFKINPDGSGFALLHSFAGGAGDGSNPDGSLIVSGGALYGMTKYGGASDLGAVFKINIDGSGYALIHSFAGGAGDGSNPDGSLIVSGGVLCGVTQFGGTSNLGTVFKINPDGSGFSLLHTFAGGFGDGSNPNGSLIVSGGVLYGMTRTGGDADWGTVFSKELPTSTISGTVTSGAAGLADVVMNGLPGNPSTNASGQYTAIVSNGWTGTVTPTLAGYAFDPASKSYTDVTSNQISQNYAATLIPPPQIGLSKTKLNFGATSGGTASSAQKVVVSNSGGGILNWSAVSNSPWLSFSPSSGTGTAVIQISVNPAGLAVGSYTGTITVSDPDAVNSPQTITVTFVIIASGTIGVPFGDFATPIDGTAGITGAIPVTGWVLDDIEVTQVRIWRDPVSPEGPSLVFIGDAIFVEGARPDVEAGYPTFPLNYRAGWGYMLLTNFLPAQGNGTFKLYAIATDKEGNTVTLGTKTITCDNAHAVKPFGTIDTPTQGGDTSGNPFVVFGWVLTPLPKTVAKDGTTIDVYVNSVKLGNLSTPPNVYNQFRPDVSGLFPGLNNSDGPVGAFYLNTTTYANGVHTVFWIARDDAGASDGIGSRYFTVLNTGASPVADTEISHREKRSDVAITQELGHCEPLGVAITHLDSILNLPVTFDPLLVKTGFSLKAEPELVIPDNYGVFRVEIPEVNRLEISLDAAPPENMKTDSAGVEWHNPPSPPFRKGGEETSYVGYLVVGDELRSLPIGSTLAPEVHIPPSDEPSLTQRYVHPSSWTFSWMPGPGFLGDYDFVFVGKDAAGSMMKTRVRIRILPKV